MPAFDPVRDAVLNSPITQSHPLSPYPRLDLQSPNSFPNHNSALPSPIVSPSLGRRATDLSVLLNSDSQEPSHRTPRSSNLSHLLRSSTEDKLATAEPLRRSMNLNVEINHEKHEGSLSFSRRLSSPPSKPSFSDLGLPTKSPVPGPSSARLPPPDSNISPSPSFSFTSLSAFPTPPSHFAATSRRTRSPALPLPQTIPYNPRNRITPAGSVLIPMSQEEMERYKDYCGVGTARLTKRKRGRSDEPDVRDEPASKKLVGDAGVVVEHYNTRPEVGVVQRLESPIIGLKNFNNWVKSVLITRFAHPVLAASSSSNVYSSSRGGAGRGGAGKVLDMGCGKGGDITKWAKARVRELFGVDIASVSVDQARSRWESLRAPRFDASFAALDCYTESLSKAFPPAKLAQPFDVVSMQFCMHYAFENVQKARCMLENVSRWLRPGGVFIGTIPNAEQLLEHLGTLPPNSEDLSFGNSIYKIRFEDRAQKPTFGHKYWFFLQDAVENVPEYIVRWDNFVQMAAEHKLHPIYKEEFHQVFEEHQAHPEFGPLMLRMKVVDASGESAMDEDQWEAANIYIAFAFEKL